jgi:hypothetical protein
MNQQHLDAFHSIVAFSSSSIIDGEPYVKFHKNTGQSTEWICYYGVYNDQWFPAWTKSGKGKTIYEAAYNAIHAKKRFLMG